jgi:glycosyltransferase involved in cell wall biosynthesis
MRIAQITPFFLPNSGGVEEYVYQISKNLTERGIEVDVLTTDILRGRQKRLKKSEIIDGIRIFRFSSIFSLGNFGYFWPSFISFLIRERYDLVHVHVYRHPHTFIAAFICKLKGIPCIITTHSPFHPSKNLIRKFLTSFFDSFFKWYLILFDRIIVVNDNEEEKIGHFIKNKTCKIPIGIPSYFISAEKEINKKSKKPAILYVGRIHESKGLDFLLKTIVAVDENLELLVVGPIEDKNYYLKLKNFIKRNKIKVRFLGKIRREKLVGIYDKAEIVFIPSPYEAFGIVILEAFSRGKPVIAVDSDGPRFLIKHGENGFLVKYGDIENAVKYIRLLLNDKKLYKKISQNNIKKAKQFTWNKIVEKIIKEVYEDVLNSHIR